MRIRASEIFVPGGQPKHTYVERSQYRLEERLGLARDNLCKLITLTGPTKSGKTVVTQRLFPREEAVWLDGGSFSSEDELWLEVVSQLQGFTTAQKARSKSSAYGVTVEIDGQIKLPLVAKGAASVAPRFEKIREESVEESLTTGPRPTAIKLLREKRTPLVLDDFHYLHRDTQKNVVRALKAVIFEGIPVVLLAIPHRQFDAVRVEREMTGRIDNIEVPPWTERELMVIPTLGFELLKIRVSRHVLERFVKECLWSPHLMQEFCRELCREEEISEAAQNTTALSPASVEVENVFRKAAAATSRIIFERLARGPRSRSDRKQRPLRSGGTVDIYGAVLRAVASLSPGVSTLNYEQIRGALRQILKADYPNANEVSRVLEKMSEISSSDESSVPVIDFDKTDRLLHITDPFFALYLKWGDHATPSNHNSGAQARLPQSE